jgi:hypothetical protein
LQVLHNAAARAAAVHLQGAVMAQYMFLKYKRHLQLAFCIDFASLALPYKATAPDT